MPVAGGRVCFCKKTDHRSGQLPSQHATPDEISSSESNVTNILIFESFVTGLSHFDSYVTKVLI